MLKSYISLLLIATATFFVGCGGASSELDGLNENEYQIVKERQDFEKKIAADMVFNIANETRENLTMLMDAHVTIMYRIELAGIKEISVAQLVEDEFLNINKTLIATRDFYYDSVNQALYFAVDVPYIYMLENHFSYKLHLSMIDQNKMYANKTVTLQFRAQPMSDNGESYLSFTYEDSILSDDVDPFILSTIEQELTQTNVARFAPNYRQKYASLLGE